MKYEEKKDLINNIIENEFKHIQEYQERNFEETDEEYLKDNEILMNLLNEIYENIPKEYQALFRKYDDAVINAWINLCRFYFKEGVKAGLDNLKFLNSIKNVGVFID